MVVTCVIGGAAHGAGRGAATPIEALAIATLAVETTISIGIVNAVAIAIEIVVEGVTVAPETETSETNDPQMRS